MSRGRAWPVLLLAALIQAGMILNSGCAVRVQRHSPVLERTRHIGVDEKRINIAFPGGPCSLKVTDPSGRVLAEMPVQESPIMLDLAQTLGRLAPGSVYFCLLENEKGLLVEREKIELVRKDGR